MILICKMTHRKILTTKKLQKYLAKFEKSSVWKLDMCLLIPPMHVITKHVAATNLYFWKPQVNMEPTHL